MTKKLILGIVKVIIVLAIAWVICMFFSRFLDQKIDELYNEKKITVDISNEAVAKYKGEAILRATFENEQGMLFMGSSELNTPVGGNAKNLIPNTEYPHHATFLGREYFQNALASITLGANDASIADNDVTLIESLTWYIDFDANGFMSNFSEQQFYSFLQNDEISDENKEYMCKRFMQMQQAQAISAVGKVSDILSRRESFRPLSNIFKNLEDALPTIYQVDVNYPQSYALAETYAADSFIEKIGYYLLQPYYFIRNDVMSLKDKFNAYKYLDTLEPAYHIDYVQKVSWDELQDIEEEYGKTVSDENEYYIYDPHYQYIKTIMPELKKKYENMSILDSSEWSDYRLFLSVCNELDIDPCIVLMPTNGYYYDDIGISAERRYEYYDQMAAIASDYGVDVIDVRDKEYEPYFFYDGNHLGWRGWPYVTQQIVNCYK